MYLLRLRLVLDRDLENKGTGKRLERVIGYRDRLRVLEQSQDCLYPPRGLKWKEEGSPELSAASDLLTDVRIGVDDHSRQMV